MADFIVALGLVLVIEGLIFAVSPQSAKNAMAHVLETADGPLRVVGIVSPLACASARSTVTSRSARAWISCLRCEPLARNSAASR